MDEVRLPESAVEQKPAPATSEHLLNSALLTKERTLKTAFTLRIEPVLKLQGLTEVNLNAALHVFMGNTNVNIGRAEGLTEKGVKWRLGQLFKKLGVGSRSEANAALLCLYIMVTAKENKLI